MGSTSHGDLRNPCLTLHQPWASLLVHGIKRVEGRSWPAPIRGRLWIHAASKVPDPETINAMEDFYREIYAVNGITDLKFPEHYPVSHLLGCVEVVGCVKREELVCWEEVPVGVRLEGQTDFCWLCEQPRKLVVPKEMRGNRGVYNLGCKVSEAAVRGLCPRVEAGPLPVKFPLPNPQDCFSLCPGSLMSQLAGTKVSEVKKSPSLCAAIAGARAAATQFSKKELNNHNNSVQERDISNSVGRQSKNKFTKEDTRSPAAVDQSSQNRYLTRSFKQQIGHMDPEGRSNSFTGGATRRYLDQQSEAPSKIFASALSGLRPARS